MANKQEDIISHLNELRNRLIVTAIVFVAFFIVGFIDVDKIYKWIAHDLDYRLIVLGPSDIIWVYFMIAGVIAIAATIPILALQIWLYVKPALKPFEIKKSLTYIPWLFILFIVGLCFGYFIVFPAILNFISTLGGDLFETSFTVEKYFKFLFNIIIPLGIVFELPVVVMFLTTIGIVSPNVLIKIRKYAYFVLVILVIIGILITPPDFLSEILVSIPFLLLYEISLILSKSVYKRRLKSLEFDYD
ncbi:twin-arginine translocase subunit TatC [Bacillus massiliigorillae]|uniref:twin-arginine translocase subunit TatC n=1 Tax=Bacillus massiliigorillae TaxID=1243664 RepID=UPI0003A3BF94|nr:twin-arginine translocase subunit TatC [Bacillus massiliigorillae]